MWLLTFAGGFIVALGLVAGDLSGVLIGLLLAAPQYVKDLKPSLIAIRKDIRTLLSKK